LNARLGSRPGAHFFFAFTTKDTKVHEGNWVNEVFVRFVVSPINVLVGPAVFFTTKDTKGTKEKDTP
jgi:hypothetical protein